MKPEWSKIIWTRAWELDDQLMLANQFINHNNDILESVCGDSKYISWWSLSDKRLHLIRVCGTLVNIVSKVSRLKSDDFNLNKKSFLHRMCDNCDLVIVWDIRHVILPCPIYNDEVCPIYKELYVIEDGSDTTLVPLFCSYLFSLSFLLDLVLS